MKGPYYELRYTFAHDGGILYSKQPLTREAAEDSARLAAIGRYYVGSNLLLHSIAVVKHDSADNTALSVWHVKP